jgi:hypothetical protein
METGLAKRLLLAGLILTAVEIGGYSLFQKIKENKPSYQITETKNNSGDLLYRLRAD